MSGHPIGVGITWAPGVEPLLDGRDGPVDVLEVEPQMFWSGTGAPERPWRADPAAVERLAGFAGVTVMRGVGFPVGGVRAPDPRPVPLLTWMISELEPAWLTERLAFHREAPDPAGYAAFIDRPLLPPRQTAAGAAAAARTARALADVLPVPFAITTVANPLRPRADELSDGAFLRAVAEAADCGLVLDLDALWMNERAGRQPVDAFVRELPLDRVWGVRVGGGPIAGRRAARGPDVLLEVARALIPRLPRLGAVMLDCRAAAGGAVSLDAARARLRALRRLWEARGQATIFRTRFRGSGEWRAAWMRGARMDGDVPVIATRPASVPRLTPPADVVTLGGAGTMLYADARAMTLDDAPWRGEDLPDEKGPHRAAMQAGTPRRFSVALPAPATPPGGGPTPRDWEVTLAAVVAGDAIDTPLARELRADPGLGALRPGAAPPAAAPAGGLTRARSMPRPSGAPHDAAPVRAAG